MAVTLSKKPNHGKILTATYFLEIASLKFYRDCVINEIQLLDTNSQIHSDIVLNRDPHLLYVIFDKDPADQI